MQNAQSGRLRARAYCFTWNNPPPEARATIDSISTRYKMYQLETGEAGTPHLQGLLVFSNAISFDSLKSKLPLCHLERTKSIKASIAYCSKSDGRLEGPWESGERPSQGQRSDLSELAERVAGGTSLRDLSVEFPAEFIKYSRGLTALSQMHEEKRSWEMIILVYHGPTGTGKTRRAHEENPNSFWKEKSDWWDGYAGEECVIWDEFANDVPITSLLRICDRYPMRVPVKGGFTQFRSKKIVFTSNIPFDEWYPNCKLEHKDALRRRVTEIVHFNPPL